MLVEIVISFKGYINYHSSQLIVTEIVYLPIQGPITQCLYNMALNCQSAVKKVTVTQVVVKLSVRTGGSIKETL